MTRCSGGCTGAGFRTALGMETALAAGCCVKYPMFSRTVMSGCFLVACLLMALIDG